MKKQTDETI